MRRPRRNQASRPAFNAPPPGQTAKSHPPQANYPVVPQGGPIAQSTPNLAPTPQEIKRELNRTSAIEKNHKKLHQSNDSRWGSVQMIQTPNVPSDIIIKEIKSNKQTEHEKNVASALQRLRLSHPHLLNLLDFTSKIDKSLCSKMFILREFWEHLDTDLHNEAKVRQAGRQPYTEAELTYITNNATRALAALHDAGRTHGDVSPLYIVHERNQMNYKLAERRDNKFTPEQVCQSNLKRRMEIYAAPEVFSAATQLKKPKKGTVARSAVNTSKADSFSLGLSILAIGTGESVQDLYNQKTRSFNEQALQQKLQVFQQRYQQSDLLIDAVNQLCFVNPAQRWDAQRLRSELPSEEDIHRHFSQTPVPRPGDSNIRPGRPGRPGRRPQPNVRPQPGPVQPNVRPTPTPKPVPRPKPTPQRVIDDEESYYDDEDYDDESYYDDEDESYYDEEDYDEEDDEDYDEDDDYYDDDDDEEYYDDDDDDEEYWDDEEDSDY